MRRIYSPFIFTRSSEEEPFSDNELMSGLEREDPRALARWAKETFKGEDMGEEFDQVTDQLEEGELPEEDEND